MADDDDDGGWGALFAKAAGGGGGGTEPDKSSKLNIDSKQKQKRKRKRHGESGNHNHQDRRNKTTKKEDDDNDDEYATMLLDRMSIPEDNNQLSRWPSWTSLGKSLSSKKCKKWKGDDDDDHDHDDDYKSSKCYNCGESALYHRLELNVSEESSFEHSTWVFDAFCRLRNIRCCAKWIITTLPDHPNTNETETTQLLDQILNSLRVENHLLQSLRPSLHNNNNGILSCPNETELLESKWQEVVQCYEALQTVIRGKSSSSSSTTFNNNKNNKGRSMVGDSRKKKLLKKYLEPVIRLMIACDAVYNRCYYLQLTRMLPPLTTTTTANSTESVFLPHPPFYFGLPYLTMDLDQAQMAATQLLATIKDKEEEEDNDDNNTMILLQQDPLLRLLQNPINDSTADGPVCLDHALSAIHRYRFLETITLFHQTSWSSSSHCKKLFEKSLATIGNNRQVRNDDDDDDEELFYQRHETPAPQILMEWRDSCRDMMCNLYAYATVPPIDVLSQLIKKHFPECHGPSDHECRILEMGAGTGYLAKQLQNAGFQLEASDVQPTPSSSTDVQLRATTMNEYHGFTPPFCRVSRSSKIAFSSKNIRDAVLLLCYPPPQSPMARDVLQAYFDAGGARVIHIGEFKGLTGTANFEKLLSRRYQCVDRYPCLTWGTDASHISIWVVQEMVSKGKVIGTSKALLLPCTSCQKREGIKRCLILRSVVYCSRECWNRDSNCRRQRFRLSMFNVEDNILDYENEDHYSSL